MERRPQISAIVSILLCFWYLTSIVGIDVHINHHDGEIFVVSLLGHTDCERLHPDDECHCMEHHHGLCHEHDEDCENNVVIISLTGDGFDFIYNFTPVAVALTTIETHFVEETSFCSSYSFTECDTPPRERLRSLCLLRV